MVNNKNDKKRKDNKLFRKTEAKLYNYVQLKSDIANLELDNEILDIEASEKFDTVKAINYSREKVFSSCVIDSEVESLVINHEAIKDIMIKNKKQIQIKNLKVKKIENALDFLNDTDRKIVELRYFLGETWHGVAKASGYSISACQKRRAKIIEKLSTMI